MTTFKKGDKVKIVGLGERDGFHGDFERLGITEIIAEVDDAEINPSVEPGFYQCNLYVTKEERKAKNFYYVKEGHYLEGIEGQFVFFQAKLEPYNVQDETTINTDKTDLQDYSQD